MTVGITTFKHRFKKYFIPLIHTLKLGKNHELEVVVAINGEHKEKFDDGYRTDILEAIAYIPNTFPIIYPKFRGLTKLWNSILLTATEDYVLLLNDDVTVYSDNFLQHVEAKISHYKTSFKINGSWSHVVLKVSEVRDLGYFDERLLGIGEEEEFAWRYEKFYKKSFLNLTIPGIINHVDMTHPPTNITAGTSGKYSKFNRDILFNEIYTVDYKKGEVFGMISEPLVHNGIAIQYPYEKFYEENKDKL